MASIIERDKSFAVVYYAIVEGKKKQIWESFPSRREARARKAEVENELNDGTFLPPSRQTIREFLQDFVALYGEEKWSLSTYSNNVAFIENYINPLIGDEPIQAFSARSADVYFKRLKKTKAVSSAYGKPRTEFAGPSVRVYAHILDEDRKVNAVKMEQAFYASQANPDLREVKAPTDDLNLEDFISKLKSAPPDKLAVLAELLRG